MSDLFTLETPEIKGRNKTVFYEAIQSLPDKTEISISPFTEMLRAMGATLSEESTSRYLRFLKKWKWGAVAVALGKAKYQVRKY